MGKLIAEYAKKKQAAKAGTTPATPAAVGGAGAGPKAPHSADWLLAKHRADQGLGAQPTDPNTPVATSGGAVPASAPVATGGMVEDEVERKRRLAAGIQL